MTVEEKLDVVEALIKDALSIHVDDVYDKEAKTAKGIRAYHTLAGADRESRADGTLPQHQERILRLVKTLIGDVFEIEFTEEHMRAWRTHD